MRAHASLSNSVVAAQHRLFDDVRFCREGETPLLPLSLSNDLSCEQRHPAMLDGACVMIWLMCVRGRGGSRLEGLSLLPNTKRLEVHIKGPRSYRRRWWCTAHAATHAHHMHEFGPNYKKPHAAGIVDDVMKAKQNTATMHRTTSVSQCNFHHNGRNWTTWEAER